MPNDNVKDPVADAVREFKAALDALPLAKRISRDDAEAIYSLGYNSLKQGRYEAAFRYFSLLTMFMPTHPVYLTGLGQSYKLMGRFAEAEGVFSWLAAVDPQDPAHTLSLGECQVMQRNYTQAKQSLDLVIGFCRDKGGFERVLGRAEAFNELIQQGAATARA